MVVYRKHIDAWTIYSGSDFDIDLAVNQMRAEIGNLDTKNLIQLSELDPIVAKRHYHETGTLRWYSRFITPLSSAENYIDQAAQGFHELNESINEAWVDSKQIINSVVAMIKKAPKEDQERLANIAKIMYNYPWYWEMSDARNTEEKARAKNAMIKKFYNELENEESENIAIDIYNAYAPGGSFRTVSEPYLSRTTTNL